MARSSGSINYSYCNLPQTDDIARMLNISASSVRKYFDYSEWHHSYLKYGDAARAYFYEWENVIWQISRHIANGTFSQSIFNKIPANIILEAEKMLNASMPEVVAKEREAEESQRVYEQIAATPRQFQVESLSQPGSFHTVFVIDGEASCNCLGFQSRGSCKHTDVVCGVLWKSPEVEKGRVVFIRNSQNPYDDGYRLADVPAAGKEAKWQ